jgi:hypothetical protein
MANRDTLTRTGVGAALNVSQHDQNINSLASATDIQTGTTYTVLYTDQNKLIELNNATMTCTLSALATITAAKDTDDWHVAIKNINSADATLNCNAADTFDGGGTSITLPQHASVVLQTNNDETVWRIASSSIGTMAEQLVLSGATAGTAVASKALVVDANKDIDLGTGDLTATQITGTLQTASQPNVTDIGTQTSADINGGAIDGTPIGASSPSTGAFTTITSTGDITSGGNFVIGSASITEAELERLDGITSGTWASNKVLTAASGTMNCNNINMTNVDIDTGNIAGAVTGTTQLSGDNSTKLATTAYVDAKVFGGFVSEAGTGHDLPSGWSASSWTSNSIVISHPNIGTNFVVLTPYDSGAPNHDRRAVNLFDTTASSFTVYGYNAETNAGLDVSFDFLVITD